MTYVITTNCIDVKDGACVQACPVDCIYEGGRMYYINPDECIDCGICLSVCPVEAIYSDDDLSSDIQGFLQTNREFFEIGVTGWGSPGGFSDMYRTTMDHPSIARVASSHSSVLVEADQGSNNDKGR